MLSPVLYEIGDLRACVLKALAAAGAPVLAAAADELHRAQDRHRPMHSAHEGWAVIREEVDELWEHVKADTGGGPEARAEAIQLAAMPIRYALDVCDRKDPDAQV